MELTEKQKVMCTLYAKSAGLEPEDVISWVENVQCTMTELSQGLLGKEYKYGTSR